MYRTLNNSISSSLHASLFPLLTKSLTNKLYSIMVETYCNLTIIMVKLQYKHDLCNGQNEIIQIAMILSTV